MEEQVQKAIVYDWKERSISQISFESDYFFTTKPNKKVFISIDLPFEALLSMCQDFFQAENG